MPKLTWKDGIFVLAIACLFNAFLFDVEALRMWMQTSMIIGAIGLSVAEVEAEINLKDTSNKP